MKHILTTHFEELSEILNEFFLLNYNRNNHPSFNQKYNKEVFNLACKIYKRGFVNYMPQVSTAELSGMQVKNRNNFQDVLKEIVDKFDKNVFFLVDENFIKSHKIINDYYSYIPSESKKNLITVKNIIESIPETTRAIFVMGGGITLDIGGFVAGLLDFPVYYLATTLLSAVDAAIGGKTGVNFSPYGKNQVGLFYEASAFYFVPEFLKTLSQEEKLCGVVEAIKHSYLFGSFETDIPILEKIVANNVLEIEENEIADIVIKNYQYKSRVVMQDPLERNGIRAALNLGHTLAHVLEALAEEKYIENIPHGIAVAHGLKFLSKLKFIQFEQNIINEIVYRFPVKVKKLFDIYLIEKFLIQDKKNTQKDIVTFSLPPYGFFFTQFMEFSLYDVQKFNGGSLINKFCILDVSRWIFNFIHQNEIFAH